MRGPSLRAHPSGHNLEVGQKACVSRERHQGHLVLLHQAWSWILRPSPPLRHEYHLDERPDTVDKAHVSICQGPLIALPQLHAARQSAGSQMRGKVGSSYPADLLRMLGRDLVALVSPQSLCFLS
jgi:hypothetical protein